MNGHKRSRTLLGLAAVAMLVLWCMCAVVALAATGLGPCGGDGGSPFAAPASPAGKYCRGFDAYFESGEPGELTTALVWLSPVAVLVLLGGLAVWRRSLRALLTIGTVALALLVAHVALAFGLPSRCSPDDESISSCQHY